MYNKMNAEPTTERGVAANGSLANHISSASESSIAHSDVDIKYFKRDDSGETIKQQIASLMNGPNAMAPVATRTINAPKN